ncbi:MAG: hypothetical protein CMF31_09875 [Kordiimonas sp.]|nr:hypothetical protein [Kordiimonas sp.]|tara:strand:- start:514 stop:1263 length:750 start_codon:yes stop_codon:yes gene_type:complete
MGNALKVLSIRLWLGLIAGVFCVSGVQAGNFSEAEKAELKLLIREYLLEHPEVLPEAFEELRKREVRAALALYEQALYKDGHSYIGGAPDGRITIVEFFDYQCGYCKKVTPTVQRLMKENTDLRVVFKELPILGPGSEVAARAVLAAKEQNRYEDFHFALLASSGPLNEKKIMSIADKLGLDSDRLKEDMTSHVISNVIQQNRSLARALGITGTPAFIIGDEIIPGAESYGYFSAKLGLLRERQTDNVK